VVQVPFGVKRVLPLKEGKREGNVVKKLFRDQLKISDYDLRFTPYEERYAMRFACLP